MLKPPARRTNQPMDYETLQRDGDGGTDIQVDRYFYGPHTRADQRDIIGNDTDSAAS